MIALFVLWTYSIFIADGRSCRCCGRIQREISSRNASWTSKSVTRSNCSRLWQAANRNAIFVLGKYCCQSLMVCAVTCKRLLETRWHICIALWQERVANHIRKMTQRKCGLWIRMNSKVLWNGWPCGNIRLWSRLRSSNATCS